MSNDTNFPTTPVPHEFERNALLDQAAHELDLLNSHLGPSGGPTTTPEGDQIRNLKKDIVRFTSMPGPEPISEENLPPRQPQIISIVQLTQKYNFYWIPIPIMLEPQSDWAYNELQLHLVLGSQDVTPNDQPKAYNLYPEEKSDTSVIDVKATIGGSVGVSGGPQANAGLEINRSFRKIKAKITHQGIDQSEVYLKISETRTLNGDLRIAVIVQLPKGAKTLKIDADMKAYRYFTFAPRRVQEVFEQLSQKVKDFFLGGSPISVGPELWPLDLPS